jgi:hypothetical protein
VVSLDSKDAELALRDSSTRVGKLYPVLLDKHGNVIDGKHRLEADRNWPKITLDHIESEKEMITARLISNVCRRQVPAQEKSDVLRQLGDIYLREGVKRGKLAHRISEDTGMSYRWVMRYLPDDLKKRPGAGGPSSALIDDKRKENFDKGKVASLATAYGNLLLVGPRPFQRAERILLLKDYANTDFVHIVLEKDFYEKIEQAAQYLTITPETLINNVLVSIVNLVGNVDRERALRPFDRPI